MWWYQPSLLLLLAAGGGGPTAVTASDTVTLSESATAVLLPVATETITLSENRTAFLAAVATDSWTLSETSVATLGNAVNTPESFTFSEVVTSLTVTDVATDAGTLSEATTLPVVVVTADAGSLSSEAGVGFAAVVAVDAFSLGELATPTSSSGGNVTGSDTFVLSESVATIPVVVVATEALTVTDVIATLGTLAPTDSFTFSESAVPGADLTGDVEFESITFVPRLRVNESAGQIPISFDSTLITWDSALVTWDGGYVGQLPELIGVRPLNPADTSGTDPKLSGSAE